MMENFTLKTHADLNLSHRSAFSTKFRESIISNNVQYNIVLKLATYQTIAISDPTISAMEPKRIVV